MFSRLANVYSGKPQVKAIFCLAKIRGMKSFLRFRRKASFSPHCKLKLIELQLATSANEDDP